MEDLTAVSITTYGLKNLNECAQSGQIHSIFEHTLNILNDNGSFLTLANTALLDGPNCIRVVNFKPFEMDLKEGMSVNFLKKTLRLNHTSVIHLDSMTVKSPTRIHFPKPVYYPELLAKIVSIQQSLWFKAVRESFKDHSFTNAIYMRMDDTLNKIQTAIQENSEIESLLQSLIGLGIGLTPSGDDFLTGFALVVSSENYPCKQLKQVMINLQQSMSYKTNHISKSQYRYALDGEARSEILTCIEALFSSQSFTATEEQLMSILTIGSSSGYDILSGILFATQLSTHY